MVNSNSLTDTSIYAQNAQAHAVPSGTDYCNGVCVGYSLPACWWNGLWCDTTSKLHNAYTMIDSIYNELSCVITSAGTALGGEGQLNNILTSKYAICNEENVKILYELPELIDELKSSYYEKRMIDEALVLSLENVPYEIREKCEKMHEVLVSPNLKVEVEKYNRECNNKFLKLLMNILYIAKEYGDKNLLGEEDNYQGSILQDNKSNIYYKCMENCTKCSVGNECEKCLPTHKIDNQSQCVEKIPHCKTWCFPRERVVGIY